MQTVPERLAALRAAMAGAGCDAYILPSSDPHSSEYAPAHYASWVYFSGFPCENANLVVTQSTAALWVDGRFFGAADAALAGTGIDSMHMGVKGVPTVEEYLAARLQESSVLGYTAEVMPVGQRRTLAALAEKQGAQLRPLHLDDQVWTENRPALPSTPAWLLDGRYAGQTPAQKLETLRARMAELDCTAALVTKLDSVAWLLNLRAADVENTPYALAFCYVSQTEAVLFMDGGRLADGAKAALAGAGVSLRGYDGMPDRKSVV